MSNNEDKKQIERLGTASTMCQTFQQSQFQQQYQKRADFTQVNLFPKNIKNDSNHKQNTRYSRQEYGNESEDQRQDLLQQQHKQQQYIIQQQNSQSKPKKIQIKLQNESQNLIEDRQEDFNSVYDDDENLESPIPKQKKGKGEHLYVNCQMQALSEILVKYNIQEINQPYLKKKTQAKCCCFTITTKQSLYQSQKQIIIAEGGKHYDENDINHCNLLYSILYQMFQLEKLTKKKSKEIEAKQITVFQLIYTLSCITLFKDDLLQFTKNDKEKVIGNLFIISKYIFEILVNGTLDPIFKQSDSNGETLHNTLTSIHMGMFLMVCSDNLNQEQEIIQNLQIKSIKSLIDLWKKKKYQNN
ncbi:unnamed protein product (macronuclear) [Paramecium tetraurelia]|uniref:Uncharacterized protein n=1 Tax=Paramecium tetraurelia TaxID=5888 RepID=A0CKK2_PARTE|nr:uncharacterized protein GSPATT00001033001 [Paramecium tetraurelia]CAK71319.1 unnamed protein product [Paramecium tetraurelia]|eukprot:XP_001438716.1 hypothetical protein (macronuclear) [Paramecium tetraurelia strain d4-2]